MALPDKDINKLGETFEWAALDIAAWDIKSREQEFIWGSYIAALPPSKLLTVFSDSLHHVVLSCPKDRNFAGLDNARSEKIFLAWRSLAIASNAVSKILQFGFEGHEKIGSDISRSIYYVADLVKSIDPKQGQVWESRGAEYKQIFVTENFRTFLNRMHNLEPETPSPNSEPTMTSFKDFKTISQGTNTDASNKINFALARSLARIDSEGKKDVRLLIEFQTGAGFRFDPENSIPLKADGTPVESVKIRSVAVAKAGPLFTAAASPEGIRELSLNPHVTCIQGYDEFPEPSQP